MPETRGLALHKHIWIPFIVAALACTGCTDKSGDAGNSSPSTSASAADSQAGPSKPGPAGPTTLMELPEVVASVAGQPIPRAEFDLRYEPGAKQILARRDDGKVPQAYQAQQRRKIIESLVWAKQLELEAERSGVDFEPEALTKLEADERRHIRDWDAWLARINQTAAIRHEANIVFLRERALFAAAGTKIEATEDELRAAYEATQDKLKADQELVRASHILVTYGPREGDEKIQPVEAALQGTATPEQLATWDQLARARAVELRALALEPGVDFNELAKEYSEGPGAFRGGDMGLFPRQRHMVEEYAAAAWALAPGEISEPVKSDKGYYVIKSFGRYPAGPLPFEAVRADLVREVEGAKYKAAKQALQAELDQRFPVVSEALDEARAFRSQRRP